MKKIFTFVVMAVAAIAMVSCGNTKVADEFGKATEKKDVARLVALGDSVKGLGDKAQAHEMATGVCCYVAATQLLEAASQGNKEIKNVEKFAKPEDAAKLLENMVALYDAAKKKNADDSKTIFDAYEKGAKVKIDDQIKKAKENLELLKKAKELQAAGEAAQQVVEAAQAEGEEVAAEAAEEEATEE